MSKGKPKAPPKGKEKPKAPKKKTASEGKKEHYAAKGGSASVMGKPAKSVDVKAEAKGTSAKPHGAAGVSGRTHPAAASKALNLAKAEGSEEYTIASVLRQPIRG